MCNLCLRHWPRLGQCQRRGANRLAKNDTTGSSTESESSTECQIPVPVLRSLKGCKSMFVLHWQGLACKLTLLSSVPSWTSSFFWSFHNSQIMCSICVSPKSQNPHACPEHCVLWVVQGEPWIEMDRYGIVCFLGVWTWLCAPFWFTDKMLEFVSGYQEPRRLYQQPATWDWQTWRMERHSHAHVDNWIRQEHHLQHYWCCRSWPAV